MFASILVWKNGRLSHKLIINKAPIDMHRKPVTLTAFTFRGACIYNSLRLFNKHCYNGETQLKFFEIKVGHLL